MKILAIRGEGLASLARRFEVDLEVPPLRDAGVFAIVGPTGAGKSTLLDAICLALFDRTPRLAGRGPRLGGEEDRDGLTARDPRHVLRRGAARGWAEVDFRGVDGRRYRARWEVRRARGSPEGKLQDSTVSLYDLETGRALGDHRKTHTLAEIEARVGLSFGQLTRAVVLAQGEFAAFLHADDRDRAELLERMTGTEVYGLVSMEVARRAKEERALEARLEERAAGIAVLDPSVRAELEARLPEQRLDVVRATARTRDLERVARWYADLDLFAREEEDARRELAEIDSQLGLAEARRRELAEIARAGAVRGDLAAVDRARRARDQAAQEEEDARRRKDGAEAALAHAEAEARAADRVRDEAERWLAARLPELARARALDAAHALASERVESARRRVAERTAEATHRREELEAELARAMARARGLEVLDPLIEERGWPERIERARALRHRCAELEAEFDGAARALAERARAAAAGSEELGRWSAALVQAERRVGERKAALGREPSRESLHAALRRIAAAREAVGRALDHEARAEQAGAREREHAQAAAAAALRAESARARSAAAEAEVAALAPALEEAVRARDLARATLELADRRADLRDGEPCPLCGATDHPFAHASGGAGAPAARLVDALDERARALEDRVGVARAELARAEAELAAATPAHAWALQEQARAERERAAAREAEAAALRDPALDLDAWWRGLPAPLRALLADAPASVRADAGLDPGAAPAWIDVRGRMKDELCRSLDDVARRLEGALARREGLERALGEALEERERAGAVHLEAEREARRAEAALERERARAGSLERERARVAGELAAIEPATDAGRAALAWAARSEDSIATIELAALDRLATGLVELEAARRDAALAVAAIRPLDAALASAADADARAMAGRDAAAAELATAELELAEIVAERAKSALGDADEAEREARARLEAARAAHARSHAAAERRREAHAAAVREHAAAVARLEAADRELDAISGALRRALESLGLDEARARSALERPAREVEAWRRDLDALDALRARARAVVEERARRREQHAADPPALGRAGLEAELARAREQEDAARRLVAGAEQSLALDDRARAARAAIGAEFEAQRARTRTWSTLDALVGSSDGKRFRVFAQGLTLDVLLAHANEQLARIAPRYALRRAPAAELAIQVIDREMGDEVRGVHGLSGGETFLVSLALALALASIAARRVSVGSLFVDEGFGGLDAESLEIALAALDALQATGRQVGVISHVPAMADRFPVRIEVRPCGTAESSVRVVG